MTDTADAFTQRVAAHDDKLKYEPKDEKPNVIAPDLELFRETTNSTDRALADGFFRHYRHLFCNGDGSLYVYHPERGAWSRDGVPNQVLAYCMHLSDRFYEELATVTATIGEVRAGGAGDLEALTRRQQAINKLIIHCEKANTMGAIARLLTAKLTAVMADRPQKMNHDGSMLACKNGVVDLATGVVRHPRPEDYITRNTGTVYKHDADIGWWEEIVMQMCSGNPRLAEFLQVWCGYCATGLTKEHAMAILWGMGRNGKNLLIDSVASSLGNYAAALPASFLESMGDQKSMDNNMLYAMAKLDGIRMSYVSETGEKGKLKESWVKAQTGDRTVSARLAHKDFYEFQLTHKLVVGTNHKPEITGTDDGVWERIRMIPMRVRFGTQEEIDAGIAQALANRDLLARATSTEGREVVLKWVVAGASKYLAHGLRRYTPPEIVAETLGYRREQDVMGQFLQDATDWVNPVEVNRVMGLEGPGNKVFQGMTLDDRLRVEKQELWRTYTVWCEEHGHHAMSATMFSRRVTGAQRFWQDDIGGEKLMRPLDTIKVKNTSFYRYLRLSENGVRMRNIARSRQVSNETTHGDREDM